jgi:hypothetical protein
MPLFARHDSRTPEAVTPCDKLTRRKPVIHSETD